MIGVYLHYATSSTPSSHIKRYDKTLDWEGSRKFCSVWSQELTLLTFWFVGLHPWKLTSPDLWGSRKYDLLCIQVLLLSCYFQVKYDLLLAEVLKVGNNIFFIFKVTFWFLKEIWENSRFLSHIYSSLQRVTHVQEDDKDLCSSSMR